MDTYTKEDIIDDPYQALVICKNCGKLVPVTLYCIYCTAPILGKIKNEETS